MTQKGDSTVEVKARKDMGVVVVVLVDEVPLGESTIFTGRMSLPVPVSVPPLSLVSILKDEDIMITTKAASIVATLIVFESVPCDFVVL